MFRCSRVFQHLLHKSYHRFCKNDFGAFAIEYTNSAPKTPQNRFYGLNEDICDVYRIPSKILPTAFQFVYQRVTTGATGYVVEKHMEAHWRQRTDFLTQDGIITLHLALSRAWILRRVVSRKGCSKLFVQCVSTMFTGQGHGYLLCVHGRDSGQFPYTNDSEIWSRNVSIITSCPRTIRSRQYSRSMIKSWSSYCSKRKSSALKGRTTRPRCWYWR